MDKEHKKTIAAIIGILLIGCAVSLYKRHFNPHAFTPVETYTETHTQQNTPITPIPKPKVLIHVAGEVKHPGIYKIDPSKRALDAIKLAGGHLKTANLNRVNLVQKVRDGKRIYVPKKKTAKRKKEKKPSTAAHNGRVNINQANTEKLEKVPHIGESTAKAIVQHRRQNGDFHSLDSLLEINGIGSKKLKKIKPYLAL